MLLISVLTLLDLSGTGFWSRSTDFPYFLRFSSRQLEHNSRPRFNFNGTLMGIYSRKEMKPIPYIMLSHYTNDLQYKKRIRFMFVRHP